MKNHFLTLGLLIAILPAIYCQNLQPIELVAGEWSPYVTKRVAGYGAITEIVTAVLNDMGYSPNYSFLHFYLGYELVKKGEVIGTFPYFKTRQRLQEMDFSAPLMEITNVFFYRMDRFENPQRFTRLQDLAGYKIGFVKGYSYGEQVDSILADHQTFNNEVIAFKMLQNGIIDFLPASRAVGQDILQRHFRDVQQHFGIIPGLEVKENVYFITAKISKFNRQFIEKFNASLKRIREEGVYREILQTSAASQTQTRLVRLTGSDSFPMVVGREKEDDKEAYLIPRGTRAIVVEWGERFLTKGKFKSYDQMFEKTRVRIIEGPLKDKILYVDNMFIEFE